MSILEEGFLSPEIAGYIGEHRDDNKASFGLAERGAIVEAPTLARTCLETVFAHVAAVKMGASFVDRILANEMGSKSKGANWMLNFADRADCLDPQAQAELQAFVDRRRPTTNRPDHSRPRKWRGARGLTGSTSSSANSPRTSGVRLKEMLAMIDDLQSS